MKKNVMAALSACVLGLIATTTQLASAQTILGSWQLIDHQNCITDNLQADTEEESKLVSEMKSMAGPDARVVTFKQKGIGEERARILNRKKGAPSGRFLYKLSDDNLMILDKKSQTLTQTYLVDKMTRDTLILSDANRPCEVRIFLKIKEGKAN